MGIRCRLGWHDWRFVAYEDPVPSDDRRVLFHRVTACQRCHERRVFTLRALHEDYVPVEGIPAMYDITSANGTERKEVALSMPPDEDERPYRKTCVRPMTREHGVMRDGSRPVRSPCGHQYKDHGETRYFGDGRYGFVPGPCKDCSCEGFLG